MKPEIRETDALTESDKQAVFALWNAVYPEKLLFKELDELDEYLSGLQNQKHFLIDNTNKTPVAWAFSFQRDGASWFAILIDASYQKKGLGRHLLDCLKKNESELNGWVIDHDRDRILNGQPYKSPLSFYLKNGFHIIHETRLELEKISAVKVRWLRDVE